MKVNKHISSNDNCVGCFACLNICPSNAILIKRHNDTFNFPYINTNKCTSCGMCMKVCPINFKDYNSFDNVEIYYGVTNNKNNYYQSSSGGAFYEICKYLIKKGYIIYGCEFDSAFNAIHGRSETLKNCKKFRKSKYIQSNLNNCFKNIEKDIKEEKKVVFSGTPCQCAAIKMYLKVVNVSTENILFIDILCHGVPSQLMFNEYIMLEKEKYSKDILNFSFKNKDQIDNIINTRTASLILSDGSKIVVDVRNSAYLDAYYHRMNYRKSCYMCNFTKRDRVSDISLGDAWGINEYDNHFNDVEGVSLVLFNTEKGRVLLNKLKEMQLQPISKEWVFSSQRLFYSPTPITKERKKFLKYYPKYSFDKAVWKSLSKKTQVKRLIRKIPLINSIVVFLRS